MIKKETVFVLGAGASWHYGYPTGEGLIDDVIQMTESFQRFCRDRLETGYCSQWVPKYIDQLGSSEPHGGAVPWETALNLCEKLVSRLRAVRPLMIDNFLAWNPTLAELGTMMIAGAILNRETIFAQRRFNGNRSHTEAKEIPDDWYRFISHKLAYGCRNSADLFYNNVHFITFNYDASLEYNLYQALTAIDIFDEPDVRRFLTEKRIIHTYGSVHKAIPAAQNFIDASIVPVVGKTGTPLVERGNKVQALIDRFYECSQSLRTIDPHTKESNDRDLRRARSWIAEAKVIYILGYGFDENNNKRIGLDKLGNEIRRTVMFTNFRDLDTINRRVSRLFGDRSDHFVNRSDIALRSGEFFKSVRNVYDALAMDFDSLES